MVSLLARSGRPLTVKEIASAVPVGQSTVSEHLRQLAAVGFVLAEERGTSRLYRINSNCVECFPHRRGPGDGQTLTRSPAAAAEHPEDHHGTSPPALTVTRSGRRSPPGTAASPGPRRRARRLPTANRARSRRAASARPGIRTPAACPAARCGPASAAATPSRWRTCIPGRRCWTWARWRHRRAAVGPPGRAGREGVRPGYDSEMLDLARANAREAGAQNAVFLRGQIEAIPLPAAR